MNLKTLLATSAATLCVFASAVAANAAPIQANASAFKKGDLLDEMVQHPLTISRLARLKGGTITPKLSTSPTDRLLFWHATMLDTNALDHTPASGFAGDQNGPTRNSRAFAMVQIAVNDAVQAFGGGNRVYNVVAAPAAGASLDTAIAYAAHDVLVALYPKQTARLDAVLAADEAVIFASAGSKAAGKVVGKAAAAAMVARRANDGSQGGEVNFGTPVTNPGGAHETYNTGNTTAPNWTPDPVGQNADGSIRRVALGAAWGFVKPFSLTSGSQFRIPAPPAQGTPKYVAGVNEVKKIGASADTAGSTTTAETQFIGNFWGYDGAPLLGTPPRLYNQIALTVAKARGVTNVSTMAYYLAAVNTALADSGIAAWDSKYFWNYWRPVTGIRRLAEYPAAGTSADVNWKPFGASVVNANYSDIFTPPFPAYPSGHATFFASVSEIMRAFFGDKTPFTFVSDEYDGKSVDPKLGFAVRPLVPVRFRTLTFAQKENGQSRVYNGVHWQWDNTEGQNLGVKVGRNVLLNGYNNQ